MHVIKFLVRSLYLIDAATDTRAVPLVRQNAAHHDRVSSFLISHQPLIGLLVDPNRTLTRHVCHKF